MGCLWRFGERRGIRFPLRRVPGELRMARQAVPSELG